MSQKHLHNRTEVIELRRLSSTRLQGVSRGTSYCSAGALLSYVDNICYLHIVKRVLSEHNFRHLSANFSSLHSLELINFAFFLAHLRYSLDPSIDSLL